MRAFRVALAASVFVALAACRKSAPDVAVQASSSAAPAPSGSAANSAGTPDGSAQAPLVIGFGEAPPELPDAAMRANDAAFKKHEAKDFTASRDGFAHAVALAPHFDLARYNLACALARTGDIEGSARELDLLLTRDLREYERRFAQDADLEAVRAAPAGEHLRARIAELDRAWGDALGRGSPMLLWRAGRPEEFNQVLVSAVLRAGVYLPESARFVPMTPSVRGARSALVNARAAAYLVGVFENCKGDIGCPRIATVGVGFAMLNTASPPQQWTRPFEFDGRDRPLDITLEDDTARFDGEIAPSKFEHIRITKDGVTSAPRPAHRGTWLSLSNANGPHLHADAPGFSVRKGRINLPDGSTVALPAAHAEAERSGLTSGSPSVMISPDGASAVVVTAIDACRCGPEEYVQTHAISRVELGAHTATLISSGKGTGAAAFAPDGTLYIQVGESTRALPSGGRAGSALPRGVVLRTESAALSCCG